jgi:ssDNA thymidine ADP-ribosyltransferase, DarT
VPFIEAHSVPQIPDPVLIFHITAIDNIASIGSCGELLAKGRLIERSVSHVSIAYENLQERRRQTPVPVEPKGTLHDYVPCHFAPRSPMLLAIHSGNVPGCTHKQHEIAHLVFKVDDIIDAGVSYAFSNYHPVLAHAEFFSDVAALDRIDWPLFFEAPAPGGYCRYWHNRPDLRYIRRKDTRQAEFLAYGSLLTSLVHEIGVYNAAAETRVKAQLKRLRWEVPVRVMAAWYYSNKDGKNGDLIGGNLSQQDVDAAATAAAPLAQAASPRPF